MGRKRCLVFVLALCLATLAGCQGSGIQNQVTTVTYDRPESYTAGGGETTQPVERVVIDWYNGSVTVTRHNGDAVAFSETANRTLEEGLTLRWRVEDGTLSLVYCQAGQVQLGDLEKDLTVLLPEDLTLEELAVDTGAAPVQVSDIAAGAMTLGTGSGAIDLQACQVTEGARLDTGSGAVSVTAETIETMEAGTGSGGVTLQAGQLGVFTAEVGSGDVTLTAGAVDQVAVSAGSGGFTLTADQAPGALSVDLTSSPIRLTLPEEASFTATLDTVSGQWHCQLPATQQGDRYVCGTGEGTYRFSTTSGDVTIQALS